MSRRETRQRKVSQKIGALSDADKQQAASARLQALELDEPIGALQEDISDDEFLAEGTDEGAPCPARAAMRFMLASHKMLPSGFPLKECYTDVLRQ